MTSKYKVDYNAKLTITHYTGWDPGTQKNIKKVETKMRCYMLVMVKDGYHVMFKKRMRLGCGCGPTDETNLYFLNRDGTVQYYNYEDMELSKKIGILSEQGLLNMRLCSYTSNIPTWKIENSFI